MTVSALRELAETLRAARRLAEAGVSQVPQEYEWDLRHLGQQIQAVRLRVAEIRQALGDVDAEPPGAA